MRKSSNPSRCRGNWRQALIKKGKAYVDDTDVDTMRRGNGKPLGFVLPFATRVCLPGQSGTKAQRASAESSCPACQLKHCLQE